MTHKKKAISRRTTEKLERLAESWDHREVGPDTRTAIRALAFREAAIELRALVQQLGRETPASVTQDKKESKGP